MPAEVKPSAPILLSARDLARCLGITVQRVNQLAGEGTLIKQGSKYDIFVNVPAYTERLKDAAAGRTAEGEDGDKLDPAYEKAMRDRVERQIKELKLSTLRGEVVPMGDVMVVWSRIITSAKNKMLALPSRLPTQIHGLTAKDVAIIQDEVRTVLDELVEDGEGVQTEVAKIALADE